MTGDDPMERMTCRITRGQQEELAAAVERGEYPNESEAVRAAIREKFQEDEPEPVTVVLEKNGAATNGRVRP